MLRSCAAPQVVAQTSLQAWPSTEKAWMSAAQLRLGLL